MSKKTPDALIIATAKVNQFILVTRDADMDFADSELSVLKVNI